MWENLYSYYCEKYSIKKDEDYEIKLAMEIEQATKDSKIDDINITKFNETFLGKIEAKITKFGMNTNEIFENFNIIMELESKLNDGDEIYIDITHSFRSNAMWMFLIINYITDVLNKNVKIEMITYGMLETQSKNENGDMIAPVVNLKAFFDLMKWIKGANEFKRYGNSYTILEMIEDKDTGKKIKDFSDSLNLNYLGTIKRNLKSIERIMKKIELMNGPGKLIIPSIVKDFIEIFGNVEKEYEFLFKLAEWNLNQKRYAMTAININEGLREFIADILETEDRGNDYNNENSKIMKYFKDWRNKMKIQEITTRRE